MTRQLSTLAGLAWCLALAGCSQTSEEPWHPASTTDDGTGSSGGTSSVGFPGAAGSLGSGAPLPPLFHGHVVSANGAKPVIGGTLLVTEDGALAAAADPDRDAIFLVDLPSKAVRPVMLAAGDEPGRLAEGAAGTLYAVARGSGALLVLDIASATVSQRVPVCGAPRGLAYDAATARVFVACRSGLLLTLDAKTLKVTRSLQLDPDLRDVLVRSKDLLVTRFLSAEILVVAEDGSVSRRATPEPAPGCAEATVLSRALLTPTGQLLITHQSSSDAQVNITEGGYGFSCGGGLVTRFVTQVNVDQPTPVPAQPGDDLTNVFLGQPMTFRYLSLQGSGGPADIALDRGGVRVVVANLGDSLRPDGADPNGIAPTLQTGTIDAQGALALFPFPSVPGNAFGEPVAVAFDATDHYLLQSREPATLFFEDGSSVVLSNDSRADTGFDMFHMNSHVGIACASCHPEGGEDGHTWHFAAGLRRTLPLQGGVMSRAPFHWDGTLADMGALVTEVMEKRMDLPRLPSDEQVAALGTFLDRIPAMAPTDGLDSAAVARGAALFARTDVGCATCHSGAQYTNNLLADVGTGGKFVTPSLLGVGLRSPLFHDGCAPSVAERFGPCGGSAHGKPELLSADERADLISFLRSL